MTIWFCIKKLRFIQLCVRRNLYLFVNWNKDVLIVTACGFTLKPSPGVPQGLKLPAWRSEFWLLT